MGGQLQPPGKTFLDHAVPKKETGQVTLVSFAKRSVNDNKKQHTNTKELPNPRRDLK